MNHKKLICCLVGILLGGCVPVISLHPLFTEEDTLFDKELLGTWVDDPNSPDTTWEFRDINEPKNAYELIFTDEEGKQGSFIARLVKLQEKLFLDVYPSKLPWDVNDPEKTDWPYNSFFLIPAHTFLKIDSVEPQLKMWLTSESEMKDLLTEEPNAVEHTFAGDRLVLTATTKELRAFILKYADDKRLFTGDLALTRR
ncbi:MAG: hypothetical protein JSW66_11215 [Phycisphaerales bacterium]|nr:MAG: hypothetical protein JSW66_11215 [Phycisphaerales bacterium]